MAPLSEIIKNSIESIISGTSKMRHTIYVLFDSTFVYDM